MKIVLAAKSVYPFHPFGGVQKYVYYYAKALARKGIDVEIIAPLDNGRPRCEQYEDLKYTFIRPSIYKYLEYPIGWLGVHLFSRSLARYLRNKDFDILHAFDMSGYQYLKTETRKPTIAHIFTDNYLSSPITLGNAANLTASKFDQIKEEKVRITPFSNGSVKRKFLAQYLFKIKPIYSCLKKCDRIFLEDQKFVDEICDLYRLEKNKGAIVPVGVDINAVDEKAEAARISREELGFNDDDIVLITVNRLAADKGIDKIVLALEALRNHNSRIKLILVGGGYQEKEIHELIDNKGLRESVRHFKDVPENELYKYYMASDIYICAFSFLGSSISTLEAMACYLPIVTTAQPWLVKKGQNGIVIESNDPSSIESAVNRIINKGDLKKQGQISREIVKDFDWNSIADRAIEQYKELGPKND